MSAWPDKLASFASIIMSFDSLLVFLDMDLLLAIGIIIFAAIISGYTSFGGALFQVPLMVMLFGPVEAVAVTRLVSMFGRAQLYPSSARTANWSEVFPLVIAIVVITPFASSVLFIADPDLIRRGIGGLVIALTIFMLSGWQYRGPRRWPASLSFGAACGALAGELAWTHGLFSALGCFDHSTFKLVSGQLKGQDSVFVTQLDGDDALARPANKLGFAHREGECASSF